MSDRTVEVKASVKNGVKRMIFAGISLLAEVALWFLLFSVLTEYSALINICLRVVALVLVLSIYGKVKTSAMKMPWIMLIMAFPFFGMFLYVLVGSSSHTREMRVSYAESNCMILPLLPENTDVLGALEEKDPAAAGVAWYIYRNNFYPAYSDSSLVYYPEADEGLEAQLLELAKAEKFIFMEYHAIENAESWKRIQDVLVERVNAGVEVRVFYDDMGSIGFVNTDFAEGLKKLGIKCRVFNPFRFGLNVFLNNRDHRKITVIDGKVGFTGGYNLANEYFGLTHPYGMWKDTGIKITGPAVKSLTAAFLEMWNSAWKKDLDDGFVDDYLIDVPPAGDASGVIMPYTVNPLTGTQIGENVYISMINKAEKYCWFCTPYLILSDELQHAMRLAAMRGVDVRIITPGIPDKKLVYRVTRSFYPPLVDAGVRIYEWAPGFCHAKMSIVDDKMATCGTINLDYRSLYHHFENGCWFYGCDGVRDMKKDFENTFSRSREVTKLYLYGGKSALSFAQMLLRLFAELL